MPTRRYEIRTRELHPETVAALIGDEGLSGCELAEDLLIAYAPEGDADALAGVDARVRQVCDRFRLTMSTRTLPDENWNARWEADYPAVELEGFLRIRAPFHGREPGYAHELVIVPEMSFGTGHHATTRLMAGLLRDFSPVGKTCFDFGCGTGVLGILAARLGAARVVATDIDARCVESTLANAARNGVDLAEVREGTESSLPPGPLDLVLANINRGVLVAAMPALAERLVPATGELWLSGILAADLALVDARARDAGLARRERRREGDWLACRYSPNPL